MDSGFFPRENVVLPRTSSILCGRLRAAPAFILSSDSVGKESSYGFQRSPEFNLEYVLVPESFTVIR